MMCGRVKFLVFLASIFSYGHAETSVQLDAATFSGNTAAGIDSFLGIPFAEPPIGNNRLRLPQALKPYTGQRNASAYGFVCPQHRQEPQDFSKFPQETQDFLAGLLANPPTFTENEDCLTLNVIRPAGISPSAKLPVLVWIYGGAWETGTTIQYNGTVIVERSISLGEPVIYVAMNYRLGGFGFLASKEIKDAKVGNLGLHDQRAALRWVKKYISQFGGDPTKTTIFGQSAGAISTGFQLNANNGNPEGLFRAAYMLSGPTWSTDSLERGQKFYDRVVDGTGCAGAKDTLDCLRKKPYNELKAELDKLPSSSGYTSTAVTFVPRVDGVFIRENGMRQVQKKLVAKVPYLQGTCDDEATFFSIASTNITTTAQVKDYLKTYFYPKATNAELDRIMTLYPQDPVAGAPFDTGNVGAISPQFKRIAAILTDAQFNAPRRFMLENLDGRAPAWSYLYKRFKSLPALGAFHSADVFNVYGGGELTDYLVHFVNHLNPNGANGQDIHWPQYTTAQPKLLTFYDGQPAQNVTSDTFRRKQISFLERFVLENPQ